MLKKKESFQKILIIKGGYSSCFSVGAKVHKKQLSLGFSVE
jgi:hypothetical protein